jgi:hypothetical protein
MRIQHWIVDWFYLGLVCGVVVLVNLFARTVSADTLTLVIFFGGLAWFIGGIICYGYEGIGTQGWPPEPRHRAGGQEEQPLEWHCASDFLIPGTHKTYVPQHYSKLQH